MDREGFLYILYKYYIEKMYCWKDLKIKGSL